MFDEKNFLYESFRMYYDNAMKARESGNVALARKNLLLAAQALYKMAKTDTGNLKASRIKRADGLVELADQLGKSGSSVARGSNAADLRKKEEGGSSQWAGARIPDISFADVVGLEDVKESIRMLMINPIKYSDKYAVYGKKTGGGVLLYGPPGTGKTMIAKAIAKEVGATFYAIKGSDIVSKWVGESERNINDLFEAARSQERAIIFIDEMDSLFGQRGVDTHNDKRVNEFLQQIDGFAGQNPNLLILGATNRPWDVDGAAVRSGRFSQKIYVPLPDFPARKYLFDKYLNKMPLAADVDINALARMTERYSGADVNEVCERAKEGPLKKYISSGVVQNISMKDLTDAVAKVTPMVDEKEIRKFEEYAGIRKSGVSAKTEEKAPENAPVRAWTAPEPKPEPKEPESEKKGGELVCEKEIRLMPGEDPVFEFYIGGDYERLYIEIAGKKYACRKKLMSWVSEPLKIDEGGKYTVSVFASKKVAEAEVTFTKGFTEDDMGI